MIDFDVILEKVGYLGRYQIAVTIALAYITIPFGMNVIGTVFISYSPKSRCYVYPFDDSSLYPNLTEEMILNLTTPLDADGNPEDACTRYGYNLTGCILEHDLSCVNKSEATVPCDQGYYYDDSLFTETIVTEFDLVCDRRILNSITGSMYMIGMLAGSLVAGVISDRFGRKFAAVLCTIGLLTSMLLVCFCRRVELYMVGEFFVAAFATACTIPMFCHVMEIVGSSKRTAAGMSFQCAFVLGYTLWSAICYTWRDWHDMKLASFVMALPLLVSVLIVPESPRWLLTSGKEKKGKKVIGIIARWNKVTLDENTWQEAERSAKENKGEMNRRATFADLFRYPGIRIVTIKVGFSWAINSMVYYGVSLNAGALAGDIFVNNVLAGVLELTSYITCALIMDIVGRRILLSVALAGAGVCLLASTVVNECVADNQSLVTLGVAFAFMAKALISASFAVVFNFTTELFPTVLRSNGVAFGSMSARIGSILSPFVIGTQHYVTWLPNTIFGAIAVIGGFVCLTFRDTTGWPMIETIEKAEMFYAGKDVVEVKGYKVYADDDGTFENSGFKRPTKL